MAQPALDVFHALDQALAAAVAAAAPSVVHVSRGHAGGTGIVWSDDLVVTSSFHTPDRTTVGIAPARWRRSTSATPRSSAAIRAPTSRCCGSTGGGLDAGDAARARRPRGRQPRARDRPARPHRARVAARDRRARPRGPHALRAAGSIATSSRDRQIPRGFAGGPLIDADGAVIGMNTRTLLRGADLAIPVVDAPPRGRRARAARWRPARLSRRRRVSRRRRRGALVAEPRGRRPGRRGRRPGRRHHRRARRCRDHRPRRAAHRARRSPGPDRRRSR